MNEDNFNSDSDELFARKFRYRVVCIDKFNEPYELAVYGEYWSRKKALRIAREKTREAKNYTTDYSIATIYQVYDDKGQYQGGDVWLED